MPGAFVARSANSQGRDAQRVRSDVFFDPCTAYVLSRYENIAAAHKDFET
jgi:hypothetical protein